MVFSLQLAACVAGLISASYWFRSARVSWTKSKTFPEMSDGAVAFTLSAGDGEDDDVHALDLPKQSRLSAWGAIWAAVAIIAQTMTTVIEALPG